MSTLAQNQNQNADQRRLIVSAAIVFLVAIVAIISMRNFLPFETEVFERLLIGLGENEQALKNARISGDGSLIVSSLFAVLISAGAFLTASKLRVEPKLFAFAQVFAFLQFLAISIIATWAAFKYFQLFLTPVTFIVSCLLGMMGGYFVRRMDEDDTRMQAQFYQLHLRNLELRDVRLQLVRQDEVERRMLAADLHDQVLNDMKRLRKKFEVYAKDRTDEQKDEIDKILSATMVEIREVMDSLCPSALEHLGLNAAIEDCLRKAGEKGGFKTRFKGKVEDSDVEKLSIVEQSLLYRLVQEALTNAIKHAEAKTVRVNTLMEDEQMVVTIADDGKGLPGGKMNEDSRGLRYMRQRADLIGATISYRPGEGAVNPGTIVEIRVELAGRRGVESTSS